MKKFALLLAVMMLFAVAIPTMAAVKVNSDGTATFTFKAPEASVVYVAGTFNAWSATSDKMTKGADGVWSATLDLDPGKYQYKFVADGKWITDPETDAAALVDDGFGGKNTLFVLNAGGAAASGAGDANLDLRLSKLEEQADLAGSFEFHGYARSGVLMTTKGGAIRYGNFSTGVGTMWPAGDVKFRLGNEVDTYIENEFVKSFKTKDGAWSKLHFMWSHKDGGYTDLETRTNDDEWAASIRQSYAEMGGLSFAPGVTFWAGRRFYNREDIHIIDYYFKDMSGIGAGAQNIDLGFGKLAVAYLTKSRPTTNDGPVGKITVEALNVRLSDVKIGPGSLAFEPTVYRGVGYAASSDDRYATGASFALDYYLGNFYGITEGSSAIMLSYGKGLGANNNVNPFAFNAVSNDNPVAGVNTDWIQRFNGYKAIFTGVAQITDNFEIMPVAALLKQDIKDVTTSHGNQDDYNLVLFGFRPVYHFSKNFALQGEIGREDFYRSDFPTGTDNGNRTVFKATIAPTLTLDTGFWARPQIRAYVTYASWNRANNPWNWCPAGTAYDTDSKNQHAITYGVQFEAWW